MSVQDLSARSGASARELRAVLRAFWHRGRGCAAPWLGAELERRSGLSPERVKTVLLVLAYGKLLVSSKAGQIERCYDLTEAGLAVLLAELGVSQQVAA